jgi:pimeloyl-ACP methyl ester carboxylesterase
MLFLHNAGNDHHIWEHQIRYFSQKYRVVAVDSLGYGRSDNPKLDYSLPLYTEMVSTIMDALGLAPVTIVATCTGAAMALNYALANPQKVKRLFLFHIATENSVVGGNLQAYREDGVRPAADAAHHGAVCGPHDVSRHAASRHYPGTVR